MKFASAIRLYSMLLIAAWGVATVGCQISHRRTPEPVDEQVDGVRKPAPALIRLIDNPKKMREDICYPESTKQQFHWSADTPEWRFKMPATGYAHAGYRFLHPFNLKPGINQYELIFKLKPAYMANHLWVGFIDGNDLAPNVLTDVSISGYTTEDAAGSGFVEIRIPLRDFPAMGNPVHFQDEVTDDREAPFDWQDVLGIRFIHNGGRLPNHEVLITNIRLKRPG
jgi:hypothetical protein